MEISYRNTDEAWQGFSPFLEEIIRRQDLNRVCEIGGGANPALPVDFIKEHRLKYTILDISKDELDKAPDEYNKLHADITDPTLELNEKYDLIFSKMLAEHVSDGFIFHKNVFKLLSDRGYAFHFFPTLYAPPFVLNFILPESLSNNILKVFSPRDKYKQGKFPAHYSWCRGPTRKQIKKFQEMGYRVEKYLGFYGHDFYYQKMGPIKKIHELISNYLTNHPVSYLTSFAYVLLRKNEYPS